MAPLLPKLRGHFAEFLHHDSLELLSILYLTTCVGLGYGQLRPRVDAFLGSRGSPTSPLRLPRQFSGIHVADLPTTNPTTLPGYNHSPGLATFLRHTCYYATRPSIGSNAPSPHHTKGAAGNFRLLASLDWIGRSFAGTGISTRCPSTTPVGLALGPDLPRED